MNNKTVIVCGTFELIEAISKKIIESSESVVFICSDDPKNKYIESIKINYVKNQEEAENLIFKNSQTKEDFLVSCYWPWKFSKKIVNKFQKHSLNFHPSPLPKDRGWYPHVHQIRNNNDSGVTLHVIDEKLDTGEIWKQKKVNLNFPLTAGEAHEVLKTEIISLFNENWNSIFESKIKTIPQKEDGNFYSKYLLPTPEIITIEENSKEDKILRKIASRNFSNTSFVKIKINDEIEKYVHISFSDNGNIEE